MSGELAHRLSPRGTSPSSASPTRGLAIGYLAMLPLLVIYEWARNAGAPTSRNVAEILLFAPVDVVWGSPGAAPSWVHGIVLCACTLLAIWSAFRDDAGRSELGLVRQLWRVFLEGLCGAILAGPLLVIALELTGVAVPRAALLAQPSATVPGVRDAALITGGAAYEELVFRVGCVSLCVLFFRRVTTFFDAGERVRSVLPIVCAVLCSAVIFAASHLAVLTQALGPGGEAFDPVIFTWRTAAGILLAGVFCWRGPGVAAWTHALFNLALYLGAGPEVFL